MHLFYQQHSTMDKPKNETTEQNVQYKFNQAGNSWES